MNETAGPYRILQECGRGSYGVVYLAESTISGQRVALKILDGQHEARELEGLIRYRECRHANLIQIHHIDRLPDGRLYYTMDAADNRGTNGTYQPDTLAARGRWSAAELIPILHALLDGVASLHKRRIIHRDIKPDNILFANGIPVLGDVGLAAPSGDASMVGTPSFLPPEVLSGARSPDERSDLYALGRTAYTVLTGFPPARYPRIPQDLPGEAAPVLAFCRAATAKNATVESCRKALNAPSRRNIAFPRWGTILILAVIIAVAVVLVAGRNGDDGPRAREPGKTVPETAPGSPSSPASTPEIPVPRTDAEIDAVLKNSEAELARKMRQLDADVAASQARMRRKMGKTDPEAVEESERRSLPPDEPRAHQERQTTNRQLKKFAK